jgi:glycosyltransferase involved in cell wall biosynthesis
LLDITVVIPSITSRKDKLQRAVASVTNQTHPPYSIVVRYDRHKEGSALTRNRALWTVTTEWVAFLDDDDEFLPHHLESLARKQRETGADVVYPLPRVINSRGNPVPRQWDWGGGPEFDGNILTQRSYINICSIVRTDLARQVGGFEFVRGAQTGQLNDDHGFYLRLYNAGAKFAHVHEETFVWYHHGNNTSGQPTKGDALLPN